MELLFVFGELSFGIASRVLNHDFGIARIVHTVSLIKLATARRRRNQRRRFGIEPAIQFRDGLVFYLLTS